MKENGKMIKKQEKELIFIQTKKFIPVDGSTVKNMVTGFMST